MPFISPPLLKLASAAIRGKHPLAVVILPAMVRAGVRVAGSDGPWEPYGSADEIRLLNEFFSLPGAPPERPFRAVWEQHPRNQWRDHRYPGRSFQRIRTDRAARGEGLIQLKDRGREDLWAFTPNCGPELRQSVDPPTRLIDLALWYGRSWEVTDLAELQKQFLAQFPLDQDALIGNLYLEDIPDEYQRLPLAPEPLTALAVAEIVTEPGTTYTETEDDSLSVVQSLLRDGYAGVIFSGPPGTSKSWTAARVANRLADGDSTRVRFVQFHASYQYEDFVEGFVPVEEGFALRPKHLLQMCDIASKAQGKLCCLVIDELSRTDPSRVFGEALTYVEQSKRGLKFRLTSGNEASIPPNLVFLATMNELDRGVDEVDAAFERRFARIQMDPNVEALDSILSGNGIEADLHQAVRAFFVFLQRQPEEQARLGHAYFNSAVDEGSLRRLWDHQIEHRLRKAFRLNPDSFKSVERQWERIFERGRSLGDESNA